MFNYTPSLSTIKALLTLIADAGDLDGALRILDRLVRVIVQQMLPSQIAAALRSEAGEALREALRLDGREHVVAAAFSKTVPTYVDLKIIIPEVSQIKQPVAERCRLLARFIAAAAAELSIAQLYGFFLSTEVVSLQARLGAGQIVTITTSDGRPS